MTGSFPRSEYRAHRVTRTRGRMGRPDTILWDGGIKVWIGDLMNGHHAETMFSRDNMGNAEQWLVDEAVRIFPKAFQ
jgi:hypothetical protein